MSLFNAPTAQAVSLFREYFQLELSNYWDAFGFNGEAFDVIIGLPKRYDREKWIAEHYNPDAIHLLRALVLGGCESDSPIDYLPIETKPTQRISPFAVLGIPFAEDLLDFSEISEGQRAMLERNGFSKKDFDNVGSDKATALIQAIIQRERKGLCGYRQARKLATFGIPCDVSKAVASKIFTRLQEMDWHCKPEVLSYANKLIHSERQGVR